MTPADPHGVRRRIVLHFPGFEPLDAEAHRARYVRAARQSAAVWDLDLMVGPLSSDGPVAAFDVTCEMAGQRTESRIHLFHHNALVKTLCRKSLRRRLLDGFASAARVVLQGGLAGYFHQAWRFGLFFVFPFLLVALALAAGLSMALAPVWLGLSAWHVLWSVPAALLFFFKLFLPFSDRLHTLHLFADWELAVAIAALDRPEVNHWLETCMAAARAVLREEGDEIVVSSHSMGSSIAAHVIGGLLEREPDLFNGRRVVFVTLGAAILQCALLRPAAVLRARIGAIARSSAVVWLEIQCLTDAIHFYKARVVALAGHPHAPQARIVTIRLKHILSPERYRRIKRDFLRVHRQYVLGPDLKGPFDFTLMTAGPIPAAHFAGVSQAEPPVPDIRPA